ncbi:unnamed protein product [Rhodiola kirilowii]
MMMEVEMPECPVCLQSFDDETIPRVLGCGHSACEACLKQLPQPFPHTIRCPACTQLIKLPPQGPSALPKNIDLLRFAQSTPPEPPPSRQSQNLGQFMPQLWSDEFNSAWKDCVLPEDSVLPEVDRELCLSTGVMVITPALSSSVRGLAFRVKGNQKVSLVRVGMVSSGRDDVVELSYFARVMAALNEMDDGIRDELRLIMKACLRRSCRVSEVYGIWHCVGDGLLYLVCEQKCGNFMERIDEIGYHAAGSNFSFGVMGMEFCEALMILHSEGLVLGCLGVGCLGFDEFGHLCVDLSGVLSSARGVNKTVAEAVGGKKKINELTMSIIYFSLLKEGIFIGPEVFLDILRHQNVIVEYDCSRFSVGHTSDVWSLACVLIHIILGKNTMENVISDLNSFQPDTDLDFLGSYTRWSEKINLLLENTLGTEHVVLCQILCKCIDLDTDSRPLASVIWKCIKYFVSNVQLNEIGSLEESMQEKFSCCIALGKLCQLPKETSNNHEDINSDADNEAAVKHVTKTGNGIIDGVSLGKFSVTHMKGHLDSITGLAVGGGFLFSSSFDKTINVWSLQDFTLVHTFRGHEHRVTALICVEKEQPFCISGDSGGGIFIWGISNPFDQEPLRKWYEEKDWRYSGIHSLAVHGAEYLYTGSGDKTIKVWSLKDFSLSCTLTGHRSVVSCLAVSRGVLYSGSWDGTVRLWSLNDHNLLTVLGEDMLESGSSVLSLSVLDDVLTICQENGCIKVWKNYVFKSSLHVHKGAVFAVSLDGKWLFSGGWDKTVHIQEILDDNGQMDARSVGFISPESVITAVVCWQGKLLVGCADRVIKAYYYSS